MGTESCCHHKTRSSSQFPTLYQALFSLTSLPISRNPLAASSWERVGSEAAADRRTSQASSLARRYGAQATTLIQARLNQDEHVRFCILESTRPQHFSFGGRRASGRPMGKKEGNGTIGATSARHAYETTLVGRCCRFARGLAAA
ncbi:hypothetical protein V8C37DRAFT_231124 [Trichoderma ceciliae]